MFRRRCSHVLLSLALVGPSLVSAVARAQASPPTATTPTSAPSPSTPPVAAPERVPLVSPAPAPAPSNPVTSISPARDQRELAAQGTERPNAGELSGTAQGVFSGDWWGHARPIIELHGYFRTRGELFHDFFLGRHNSSFASTPGTPGDPQYLWPIPLDQSYTSTDNKAQHNLAKCGPAAQPNQNCYDKTESSANLRLRINPELAISDNLRIVTQLDLLDNLVLGSTPDSYANQPAQGQKTMGSTQGFQYPNGYQPAGINGYAPVSLFSTTQGPPTAGVNSWTNSIAVKRAWAEYMTPLGQIRFGRMPSHWGLGMVSNSGDGIDSDYQTTIDRILFVSGLKSLDLYFGAAWDFPSTGPTNANPFSVYGGQPYNTCNLCNVNEWSAFIAHRTNAEIQKLQLSRGDLVLNGGLYAIFRSQYLDVMPGSTPMTLDTSAASNSIEPRQAWTITPDLWVQALWRKLRFEAEAVTVQGQIGYLTGLNQDITKPVSVRQYGVATQTEFKALDDKLDLQFGFGWASGDPYAYNTSTQGPAGALQPGNQLQQEYSQGGQTSPLSTFRFHPDYRIDLIFFRNILSRVEGTYYFRPSVDYDFLRHADGERFGGGAALIWSRASEFEQAPGHKRDLGVEIDLQLYYQSRDGSLNDDPSKIGGFFTMLQYGVFFPMGGLDYLPGLVASGFDASLATAQTLRLFLGVVY
jgi:uncharacterized protein (TIGR04551 family)